MLKRQFGTVPKLIAPPKQRHTFQLYKTIQGGITMEFEGYCVKCREKQMIKNGTVEKTAKGKPVAKGTCPKCGTKVNRFLSSKDVE